MKQLPKDAAKRLCHAARRLLPLREELLPGAVALAVIVALNVLMVEKHYDVFAHNTRGGFWAMFGGQCVVAGYDPILYLVLSSWKMLFVGFRHPLLLWMLYPAAELNGWLMENVGLNCAQIITAAMLTATELASLLLLHRLLRRVVGLGRGDTALLCALFFSFAYVMVPMVVPDHFALSQCLLLLTLYITGQSLRTRKPMPGWLSAALFTLLAGITLSNGPKAFMAQWAANGRKFWHWRNLLLAVAVPSALMLAVCFTVGSVPRHKTKAERLRDNKEEARMGVPIRHDRTGEPISTVGFFNWTDVTTPRLDTAVENLFGESIQLHQDHLLGDVWTDRPVVVRYRWAANYAAEAAVVLLFAFGAWCGRRDRFLWLCLAWFGFDMLLSMVLGFAINEIWIMGPHWLFVIPIAAAYAFKRRPGRSLAALRVAVLALAAWLWAYNGTLFVGWLME